MGTLVSWLLTIDNCYVRYYSHYIMEQLHQGTNLVLDRYAYSGVAFSSAKQVSLTVSE